MSSSLPERVRLEVPWLTILKVLSAAALVWIWLQLWPIVMVVLVSLVLTVTFEPVVSVAGTAEIQPGSGRAGVWPSLASCGKARRIRRN